MKLAALRPLRHGPAYLLDALFPRLCALTGRALARGEHGVRLDALAALPQTHYHLHPTQNELLARWAGCVGVTAAAGCFVYEPNGAVQHLVHTIKYGNRPDAAQMAGRFYGGLLAGTPLVQGAQAVVPIPLHPTKQRQRGYNQAEAFAQGLCLATGLAHHPKLLARTRHTPSQTHLGRTERAENVRGAFEVRATPPPVVMLVDDVATTGATLAEAAQALLAAGARQVRIATLAVAALAQPASHAG
jgi:ComF family protein